MSSRQFEFKVLKDCAEELKRAAQELDDEVTSLIMSEESEESEESLNTLLGITTDLRDYSKEAHRAASELEQELDDE